MFNICAPSPTIFVMPHPLPVWQNPTKTTGTLSGTQFKKLGHSLTRLQLKSDLYGIEIPVKSTKDCKIGLALTLIFFCSTFRRHVLQSK